MKKNMLVFIGLLITGIVSAQVKLGGAGAPVGSALLEMESTTRGLLAPRMTLIQRNAIVSPATGLLVFQTDFASGFYYYNGAAWIGVAGSATDLILPFSKSQSSPAAPLMLLNNTSGAGADGAIQGISSSTTSSATAIRGTIASLSPGGFSTAVRGINNGTGGLGVGVWGSQDGSGWGVYGSVVDGLGVYGNSTGSGYGVFANSNSGTGLQATSNTGIAANFTITNSANVSDVITANTNGNGTVIEVNSTGIGNGINATTAAGTAFRGTTSSISAAGLIGTNTGGGETIVGLGNSNIAGAVVGRQDGGGYGVRGFVATNATGTGIGVLGQVGISGSKGRAGRFENSNLTNIEGNTLEVYTIGNGNIPNNTLGNAASFLVDNTNSVAAAVRGEVKTIFGNFGAAGIFGVSSGTGGFAGLFHASNPAGNGPALISIADGNGNAITANAANTGDGVETTVDGTGNAIYGWVPTFSMGKPARFVIYNSANANPVITAETHNIAGNLAVFKAGTPATVNVARINGAGRGFFNGGTQVGGADVAEYFEVEGSKAQYEPGDVLIISQSTDREVEKSATPYSTLVAGVYATNPGVLLTEKNAEADQHDEMVPMGVIGVIPTKVCMEGGAIKRGDLLVTSSIPGVAMKADIDKVKPGQVIGKALQEYNSNSVGKIKVLVSIK